MDSGNYSRWSFICLSLCKESCSVSAVLEIANEMERKIQTERLPVDRETDERCTLKIYRKVDRVSWINAKVADTVAYRDTWLDLAPVL